MTVRLTVSAVIAADRRLNHALPVVCGSEAEKTRMACVGVLDVRNIAQRSRGPDVPRNRVADERSKLLLRDFH